MRRVCRRSTPSISPRKTGAWRPPASPRTRWAAPARSGMTRVRMVTFPSLTRTSNFTEFNSSRMIGDLDHYEAYYADKLWRLLPAVYRAEDTDNFDRNGPLRELVNRIGAQAAIVRGTLDRLWEDQSIETCDDWVLAYIGDQFATNLVANLDARGQRLDVAKTIYYRRRKGTVAILEEMGNDITGWDIKVVEFFRRLGRTRHGLDPALGLPMGPNEDISRFQQTEGLVGPLTRTAIGGTARLTYPYGAGKAQTAFDEFYHTADFRLGGGQVGWHNNPRF